jgi:hypothetical protein
MLAVVQPADVRQRGLGQRVVHAAEQEAVRGRPPEPAQPAPAAGIPG